MRFTASWVGPHPEPGDVLIAAFRPRFGYVIERIVRVTRRGRLIIEVDRYRLDELPELPPGARAHVWRWSARRKAIAARPAL